MARGRSVLGTKFIFEQFKMDQDGVNRIFNFVTDAGSKPADGGHSARELQLRLDLFNGFKIVQSDKGAETEPRMVVVNEIDRGLNAPARFCQHFFLHQGYSVVEGLA